VGGVGEDELRDARPALQFYLVVDFEEALAAALVAGVPDGGVGVQELRSSDDRRRTKPTWSSGTTTRSPYSTT